jgi:hypothetical protein
MASPIIWSVSKVWLYDNNLIIILNLKCDQICELKILVMISYEWLAKYAKKSYVSLPSVRLK